MMSGTVKEALATVTARKDLAEKEAEAAMNEVMEGRATPAQIAAFLTALKMKGETVDEITGFARVMRAKAHTIRPGRGPLIDTCGTGGDGANTFNISTAAAFVVAGAGLPVAKHGNRAASSRCGSADLLEALGVRIDLTPAEVEGCIESTGLGFLFAPQFHQAMKHAAAPRRELGIRTVFNVLGPLTNPAHAQLQLLGVYHASLTGLLAEVLGRLGVREAFVVHGLDGVDEISISAPTRVAHLREGRVSEFVITPEDAGLMRLPDRRAIAGGDAAYNARLVLDVLKGEKGPCRTAVTLNAAAALQLGGLADDLRQGVRLAEEVIDAGEAYQALCTLRQYTNSCRKAV
ncbi:MAG TPA: anthranilate phosphoribosyltransferase [Firmicutes bacterium]|nr:anthranilate phosphoribosyltransferase [Bacillota bacterium]